MKQSSSLFKNKVIEVVRIIPTGKVASYGEIALYVGAPRAARQVGWILRESGEREGVPWWRVINQKGFISIKGNMTADRDLQRKLLEAEGIEVKEFQVDMEKYRFNPDKDLLKRLELDNNYISKFSYKL